ARVDAALRSLGVRRRPRGPRSSRTGWESLTETELRVAGLAAAGLTNRQIGERLFVSPRTVETHLGHAFAKLGVATRAHLAAEVARHA
ncbi:MAG: helix-turn-helix domain-containing protein, partial [Acidimicrobiales bacterium]